MINSRQNEINERIQYTRQWMESTSKGQNHKQECEDALKQWDYDTSGNTTPEELFKFHLSADEHYFSNNKELLAKANKISAANAQILAEYAGEDGILDAAEYSASLGDKYGMALLDEYNNLRELAEAQKNSSKTGNNKTAAQNSSQELIGGIFGAIGNVIGGPFKATGNVISGLFSTFTKSGNSNGSCVQTSGSSSKNTGVSDASENSNISESSIITDILNNTRTKKSNGRLTQLNKELQELKKSGADENQIKQKRQEILSEIRKFRSNR